MTMAVGRWRLRGRSPLVLGVCALVLAGCANTPPPASTAPSAAPSSEASASPPAPASASPTHSGAMPGDHGGLAVPASPQDAALQLESLLGQHAVLAGDMMRGRIRNDEDFGQAANAAIGRNTDDLGRLVGALFGDPAAAQFRTIWADHVTALFNYSRGLATDDATVCDESKTALVDFENKIANFFSAASQGRLPVDAAKSTVLVHVDHLIQQTDAYKAKDFARSNQLYREGYAHTFGLGHALATTLLPPDQAKVLDEPQWRLRSTLDRLLGEHVALAVGAMRAGATNSPDFSAAADALNANTTDISAAVGSLFGAQAGTQFMSLWADHVDQFVSYSAGLAADDEARRQQATAELRNFEGKLSAFLAGATGDRMGGEEVAKALLMHDETLLRGVDAFVAKDYQQANDIGYQTYQDIFGLARKMSDAFGATVAARMPQGGAQTGAGGTASRAGPR
jgi:hypothetical protein